jgi:hypothetical protein
LVKSLITSMEIQHQNLLEQAIASGFNLFLGAGFPVLAQDRHGRRIPVGSELCKELKQHFDKKGPYDLAQLSTILFTSKRGDFIQFLTERFTIKEVPEDYEVLLRLGVKNIYTTNIDNLIVAVYAKSKTSYLNDVSIFGEVRDPLAVNFSALHGSILHNDKPIIFDVSSLANTYAHSPRAWGYLSKAVEKYPTVFWGYSMNDNGVIRALSSNHTFHNAQKDKWIILREEEKELAEYYQSMGFKIIVSNTAEFLKFLQESIPVPIQDFERPGEDLKYYFSRDIVPSSAEQLRKRPISDFFQGFSPIWSDIFSNQIYRTSHYETIKDQIVGGRKIIILGTPASGKSTLMMLLGAFTTFDGVKLTFNSLEVEKAQRLTAILGKRKALVLVDNFCDSLDAFNYLSNFENIVLVGFEREHNYGITSHLVKEENFFICNVTALTDSDVQGVYDSLPASIRREILRRERNSNYANDSIFELITRNVKSPSLSERFKNALQELEDKSPLLAEFLILCSYFHTAKVPVSFEMALSYFSDDVESYHDIYDMRAQLGEMLKDYYGDQIMDDEQDYYYPRSIYAAETLLKQANPTLLRKVMEQVLDNIPTVQICSYNTFRKYAYDKNLALRAFGNWREGKVFYERVYENDFHNPYVLQQGALYLAAKKSFSEAFVMIDRAINQTNNRYFSIRNSHAIILFDANISAKEESESVRGELDRSMNILERCINDDKRRIFHALRFGEQAIAYHTRYYDENSLKYIKNAKTWLLDIRREQYWNYEVNNLLGRLELSTNN